MIRNQQNPNIQNQRKRQPTRLDSRERYRHDHDQNVFPNHHGRESSYRAQAEFDNAFTSSESNSFDESEADGDLSYEEQYQTDGEAHNYSGTLADDKFGEYPRYGKNLNRHARLKGDFAGVGPRGYVRSDSRIEEEVCEALARDKYIDASDINVAVQDGVVTLSGSVKIRDDRLDAEVLTERVLGVEDIKNEIKVENRKPRKQNSAESFRLGH